MRHSGKFQHPAIIDALRGIYFADRKSIGYKVPVSDVEALSNRLNGGAVAWVCLGVRSNVETELMYNRSGGLSENIRLMDNPQGPKSSIRLHTPTNTHGMLFKVHLRTQIHLLGRIY